MKLKIFAVFAFVLYAAGVCYFWYVFYLINRPESTTSSFISSIPLVFAIWLVSFLIILFIGLLLAFVVWLFRRKNFRSIFEVTAAVLSCIAAAISIFATYIMYWLVS